MAELRQRYDLVILDAAPVLSVTDGAIAATLADGALLVARHGVTTSDQAARAAEALQRVDARLLGTVLNGAPGDHQSGYEPAGYGVEAERRPTTIQNSASLGDMFH